jgi:hypothetical protein
MATARHSARGKLAILTRFHPDDTEAIEAARRDYRAEDLAEHVKRVVDQAPALTFEQIGRITSILTNAARDGGE